MGNNAFIAHQSDPSGGTIAGQSGSLVDRAAALMRGDARGKTVELRGHPESSSFQAAAERRAVAGVMT